MSYLDLSPPLTNSTNCLSVCCSLSLREPSARQLKSSGTCSFLHGCLHRRFCHPGVAHLRRAHLRSAHLTTIGGGGRTDVVHALHVVLLDGLLVLNLLLNVLISL